MRTYPVAPWYSQAPVPGGAATGVAFLVALGVAIGLSAERLGGSPGPHPLTATHATRAELNASRIRITVPVRRSASIPARRQICESTVAAQQGARVVPSLSSRPVPSVVADRNRRTPPTLAGR